MTNAPSSTEKFLIASRIFGSSTLRSALGQALERVDGELPALLQHVVVVADGDDRPDGVALEALLADLQRELDERVHHLGVELVAQLHALDGHADRRASRRCASA